MANEWDAFPEARDTLNDALDIANGLGANVTSAYRTHAKQAQLYADYKAGRGPLAAPPGHSDHEFRRGVDILKDGKIDIVNLVDQYKAAGLPVHQVLDEGAHYHVGFASDSHVDPWNAFPEAPAPTKVASPVKGADGDFSGFPEMPPSPSEPISKHRSFWERFKDDYSNATETGLVGYGIRRLSDILDIGKPENLPPGMTAAQAEKIHDRAIIELSRQRRAEYEAKNKADPGTFLERWASAIPGNILGGADPTYLIGGPAGKGALAVGKRIATQAGVNAVQDAATQGLELNEGTRDKFSAAELALNALAGGVFQGAGEALGKVARAYKNRGETPLPKMEDNVDVTLPGAEEAMAARGLTPEQDAAEARRLDALFAEQHKNDPATSRESFDETAQLMSRFEEERLPNESREDFVRRKTAEEYAPNVDDATAAANVANDSANLTDERVATGPRRSQERFLGAGEPDRRVTPTPSPATLEDLSGRTDTTHDVDEYTTEQVRQLIEARLAERRGQAPVENNVVDIGDKQAEKFLKNRGISSYDISQIMGQDISHVPQELIDHAHRFGSDQLEDIMTRLDRGEKVSLDEELAKTDAEPVANKPVIDPRTPANDTSGPTIDPEAEYAAQTIARGGGAGEPPVPPPPGRGEPPMEPPPEPPKGTAGNINLDRVSGTKDLHQLYRDFSKDAPTNEDRAQGHTATKDLANDLGMTPEALIQHNPKLTEAPQYAVALRNYLKEAGERFLDMARKVSNGDQTPETMRNFLLAQARMAALMERTMEVTGAGGRLLDSFNIKAKGGDDYRKLIKTIPNDLWQNPENAKRLADMVSKTNDPAVRARLARDSLRPRAEDYLFSAWYNWGLLSGSKTHAANIFSNTLNLFTDLAEHGIAAAFGQTKRFSGNGDRVMGREVAARVVGMIRAMSQVGPNMKMAFREGAPLDQVNRMERPHVYGNSKLGMLAEISTRAMAAQDEFFRTVASMSELFGLGFRNAAKEGKTGKDLWTRAQELADNPTDEMLKAADNAGKRLRFQDEPSAIGKAIEQLRSVKPDTGISGRVVKGASRLLVPFVRTPDSLIRTTIRRSPLGFWDRYNKADWKAGGARRDLVKARISIGMGLAAYAAVRALSGNLTGSGPVDPRRREQLEATGWRANSIRDASGRYVNLQGYEPLSTNLTAVATLVERHQSGELNDASYAKAMEVHILDLARTMNDNAWTKNLTDTLSMLDPRMGDSKTDNTAAGVASSLVTPAFVRQINQDYLDPVKRDTRGDGSLEGRIGGRIQSGIPGQSNKLPPSYDVYGREVHRADAYGPDALSRLNANPTDPDPVSHEVERLSKAAYENKVLVGPPGTRVGGNRLSPSDFEKYQQRSGTYIHDYLSNLMGSAGWRKMSDAEKVEEVKGVVRDMRKAAREELFEGKDEG